MFLMHHPQIGVLILAPDRATLGSLGVSGPDRIAELNQAEPALAKLQYQLLFGKQTIRVRDQSQATDAGHKAS